MKTPSFLHISTTSPNPKGEKLFFAGDRLEPSKHNIKVRVVVQAPSDMKLKVKTLLRREKDKKNDMHPPILQYYPDEDVLHAGHGSKKRYKEQIKYCKDAVSRNPGWTTCIHQQDPTSLQNETHYDGVDVKYVGGEMVAYGHYLVLQAALPGSDKNGIAHKFVHVLCDGDSGEEYVIHEQLGYHFGSYQVQKRTHAKLRQQRPQLQSVKHPAVHSDYYNVVARHTQVPRRRNDFNKNRPFLKNSPPKNTFDDGNNTLEKTNPDNDEDDVEKMFKETNQDCQD